jgi:hypothetical protein
MYPRYRMPVATIIASDKFAMPEKIRGNSTKTIS